MRRLPAILSLALVVTATGYAATQHSASVTIYETVHVGAKTLPAGDYSLHWPDGAGVVDLSITGNKQNLSVPITVTPRVGGDTNVIVTGEGNATVLQGFQVKAATLMIKDSEAK